MKPEDFVKKYYPFAKEVETETSIPAIAILAQAVFLLLFFLYCNKNLI